MATLVQHASNTITSGSSVTVTLGSAATLGNCLVVCVGTASGSTTVTVSGITLGGSADNFAKAKAQANTSSDHVDTEIWTDQDIGHSSTSVVVTLSGSVLIGAAVYVMEWSGIAATSAVDKTNGGTGTTSFSSGSSGTLTQANELIIGAVTTYDIANTPSITGPSSPWTNLAQLSPGSTVIAGFVASYETVTATTAQTYNGTISNSAENASVIVTLLELSNITLSPAVATVAIATPQPKISFSIPAGLVTVTIATPQPSILVGKVLSPSAAAISIAVPQPTLTYSATLRPSAATVTIATPQPSIKTAIPAGLSTVAIAAPQPSITFAKVLSPSAATVTIATPQPTVNIVTPELLISIAPIAGTDPVSGASYQAGLTVGADTGTQVLIAVETDNTGILEFVLNNNDFLNAEVNSAILGSPEYASMGIYGPALTESGHGDYVGQVFNSANISGTSFGNFAIFYVDTSGGYHEVLVVDGNESVQVNTILTISPTSGITPVSGVGNLAVNSSGELVYVAPGGTETIIASGP